MPRMTSHLSGFARVSAAVDWILARARSAVNVMADLLVAILLDRWDRGSDVPTDHVRQIQRHGY